MKLCVVVEPAERRVIIPGMTYQFTKEELVSTEYGNKFSMLMKTINMLKAATESLEDEARGEIEKLSIG